MICLLFLLICSVFGVKHKRLLLNDQDIIHQMEAEIHKLGMEIQVQHKGKYKCTNIIRTCQGV